MKMYNTTIPKYLGINIKEINHLMQLKLKLILKGWFKFSPSQKPDFFSDWKRKGTERICDSNGCVRLQWMALNQRIRLYGWQ